MSEQPKSLEERSAFRRQRIRTNRAQSFEAAEQWDLAFWQSLTPQERLSALVAIRRDVEMVQAARPSKGSDDSTPEAPG